MNAPAKETKILVVDDDPVSQKVATIALKKSGATVTAVDDGQAAVDAVFESERNGQPFEVIIMDILMPIVDGLSATRTLREQGYSGIIIAATTLLDKEMCLEAGCDVFLAKPFAPSTLVQTVEECMVRQSD